MANPLPKELITGTFGELLVQLRLLQYGVQAAPPLKDSGNDLIALKGNTIKTIQVKTATNKLPPWPREDKLYHLLAIVRLTGENGEVFLDKCEIFLIPKEELKRSLRKWDNLYKFSMSAKHVSNLFV